ncbi:hypothetical protein M9H77_04280 [Catharanthus roseus]|uniref:Uncharacterized protein n=1 Tax=Catharanthus roseus TaxID=4058 RepID=A0ACC0CDX8_CATRO|nr:hypothetical protein M9H77_04280 [Catharanthus roseus]
MVSLVSLYLSNNNLSGAILQSMEKQYLKYLDVSRGPFLNFTGDSFAFNEAFCGEKRLHVPPFSSGSFNKRKVPKVVVIVLIGIAAFVVAMILGFKIKGKYCRYHGIMGHYERISYNELVLATDEYHEKNFDGRIVVVKVFNVQFERSSQSFDIECMVLS